MYDLRNSPEADINITTVGNSQEQVGFAGHDSTMAKNLNKMAKNINFGVDRKVLGKLR